MADTVTIPLKHPVTHNGATYQELTMRRPLIGDQVDAFEPGMNQGQVELALAANLCGIPYDVARLIDLRDYREVQAKMANFPSSPSTAPDA